MPIDISDHDALKLTVYCTLYEFIVRPRQFHSSSPASNTTLSLPETSSLSTKLPCGDQVLHIFFSVDMTKESFQLDFCLSPAFLALCAVSR